jgi:hypothetical protein
MSDKRPVKVIHNVQNWEDLLKLSDPLAPKPAGTTAENPLLIHMARAMLVATVKASLAAIELNRDALDTNPELKAETAGLVVQREQLLAWLESETGPTVYVSLYPITEFELVDPETGKPIEPEPESPRAAPDAEWHDAPEGDEPQE